MKEENAILPLHTLSSVSAVVGIQAWFICQQSNAYFEGISSEGVPCGFGNLATGCCPSMLLQSEHVNCVSHVKIFC